MKRFVATLTLGLALAVPGTMQAQHQHHNQPSAPQATQSTQPPHMKHMADMEKLQSLLEASSVAIDRAAEADDPAARRQYLEESRAKLAEFKAAYEQHHQQMAEHMKSCPMMSEKSAASNTTHDHSGHH